MKADVSNGEGENTSWPYFYLFINILQNSVCEYIKERRKMAGINVNTLNFYKCGPTGN